MEIQPGFAYEPTTPVVPAPPVPGPPAPSPPSAPAAPGQDLGALAGLIGSWSGSGFNAIWRPFQPQPESDRFLELNITSETLQVDAIPGDIPNRGLLQGDLIMSGLRYLQQIRDANLSSGLHVEPGVWLSIPATSAPAVGPSIARMGSVPHGTSFLAQGTSSTSPGPPSVPAVSLNPFSIGQDPTGGTSFPEQQLATATTFRTTGPGLQNITQPMLDDPNSVLRTALGELQIESVDELRVSTDTKTIIPGGGTANTAFLQGAAAGGGNADGARVDATIWLLRLGADVDPSRLFYTQTVLLNFNGLSWPHVTVGVLTRNAPGA